MTTAALPTSLQLAQRNICALSSQWTKSGHSFRRPKDHGKTKPEATLSFPISFQQASDTPGQELPPCCLHSPTNGTMADIAAVEETFKRVQSHKGVLGVLVVNADGIAIRSTFDNDTTVAYASLVSFFTVKARGLVKQLDMENELKFVRVRSKKHEIMIAPEFEPGHEYYLVVVQDPRAGSGGGTGMEPLV